MVALEVHSTWWKEITTVTEDGDPGKVVFKLNEYAVDDTCPGAPLIFWELRYVLPNVFEGGRGVHQIMHHHMSAWKELAQKVGLRWCYNFHPSTKSALSKKAGGVAAHEFEVSTALLIAILAEALSRKQAISAKARAVLSAFVVEVVHAEACKDCVVSEIPEEIRLRCLQCPFTENETPVSMQQALALNFHFPAAPQIKLLEQLRISMHDCGTSDTTQEFCEWLLIAVSLHIDKEQLWVDRWTNDYLADGEQLIIQGAHKRRKMDVGLQAAIASDVVQSGRASTIGAFLRSHPDLYKNPHHAIRFSERSACAQISTGWLSFANSSHISVNADGVRCGSPAADVMVAAVMDPENLFSTWLPSMDR